MIFISAGHHPGKTGAKCGDFVEHEEAKIWASIIANHLGQSAIVVPVGTLRRKVAFINEYESGDKIDIAVEIHFNAAVDANCNPVGHGCETLYYPGSDEGVLLAETVQRVLSSIFPPNRGSKPGYYRMNPRNGADFFLARTVCPSIIIEPEFVHNSSVIVSNRSTACAGIAEALSEYCSVGVRK